VVKHRVSPFVGTDLETLLRANGIDTLVLAGVHTSGVVLSTVCHAVDLNYRLVVVRDCCADPDAEERLRQIDESIDALIEVITAAVSPAVSGHEIRFQTKERAVLIEAMAAQVLERVLELGRSDHRAGRD
jgi:isochorismate hydrolase